MKLYSLKSEELAIIGKTHQRWASAFQLASKIILFDQILSGIHDSIFRLVGDDSQKCLPGTHASGAVLYIISVIAWGILLSVLCYKEWPTTELSSCPKVKHVLLYFGLWVFYTVYIIADTPWPWECYTNTDLKKSHITARLVLLVFSLALVSILVFIYCVTVCIPSLRFQAMHRLAFDGIGEDLQEMRKVYEYEDIPLICRHFKQENGIKPHFSLKFDEGMRSASYSLMFMWDYDSLQYKGLKASDEQVEDSDSQRLIPSQGQGKQTGDIAGVQILSQEKLKTLMLNPKTIIFGPIGFKTVKFILVEIKEG